MENLQAENQAPDETEVVSQGGRGCWFRMFVTGLVVLAMTAGAIWFTLMTAQNVPEFYQIALETDMQQAVANGQEFERNLIKLQNTARRSKPWIIDISEAQVNGWFASDLPEKFPDSLPADIQDPRAVISQEEIRIAFKYKLRKFIGIVVISANVFCTDKPNEIAVKINSVKTGLLPLPIGPWLERVADSIRNVGIPVFWTHSEGVPVAIFTLPDHITTSATNHVNVEAIDLRPGKLVIAGNTKKTIDENQQEKIKAEQQTKRKASQERADKSKDSNAANTPMHLKD